MGDWAIVADRSTGSTVMALNMTYSKAKKLAQKYKREWKDKSVTFYLVNQVEHNSVFDQFARQFYDHYKW